MDKKYWANITSKILRTEMTKRGMKYDVLVEKLAEIGVSLTADDLRARVSRGNFSAALFVQCLRAMGVKNLPFDDSYFE